MNGKYCRGRQRLEYSGRLLRLWDVADSQEIKRLPQDRKSLRTTLNQSGIDDKRGIRTKWYNLKTIIIAFSREKCI